MLIFFYVNDKWDVDIEHAQIMHCILCYIGPINASNLRTETRKKLISYYKTNWITSLKKHVDAHHTIVSKIFEEEMNKLMQGKEKMRPTKNKQNVYGGFISKKLLWKIPWKGWNVAKHIPWRHGSLDCKKKFANIIHGKCLA